MVRCVASRKGFLGRVEMSDRVLEVSGLTKRFDELVAVNDVSLQIDHGETYGLLA